MLNKSLRTHYGRITDVTPHAQISVSSQQFSSYVDETRHGSQVPHIQQSCVFSTWLEHRIVNYRTFKSTITDVTSADTAFFCLFLAYKLGFWYGSFANLPKSDDTGVS